MASRGTGCLVLPFCILACILPVFSVTNTGNALNRTLNALDKVLDYFEEQHENLNLDAIIGTRMVEGQMKVLLHRVNSPDGPELPEVTVKRLQEIAEKADLVSDQALPYVKASQPKYLHRIGPILERGFWSLDTPSRDVDMTKIERNHIDGEAIHEDDSDQCLTELFGTGDRTTRTCQISRHCWTMMTAPGYRGYSLSHEVFYLQIGQLFGCFRGKTIEVLDELRSGFCANMYQEANQIATNGLLPTRRDLFMEIPALCGMEGYRQFFHDDWLDHILSWQHPQGCFGAPRQPRAGEHGRFKREERDLPDGCQCHRSAVAMAALVQYVRFIVEFQQTQAGVMR